MDPEDNTQSPLTGQDGQSTNAQVDGQSSAVPPGVQKRIDEMTAQLHEARRAATEAQQAAMEAMSLAARGAHQPQAPVPPQAPVFKVDLPEGMDPGQAAFFTQLTGQFQAALDSQRKATEAAMAQMAGSMGQQSAHLQLQMRLASQPPAVQDLAQKLMADWQRSNKSGWAPEDAISFARYNLGLPREGVKAPPPAPNGDAGDQTIVAPSAGTPNLGKGQVAPPLSDIILAKMSPAQQEAYWAKRIAAQSNGKVDVPIEF